MSIHPAGSATPLARLFDVQDFINKHALSRVQILLLVRCFLVVAADGFDTAAIGFIAPAIRAEWVVSPVGLGLRGAMPNAITLTSEH